MYVAGNGAGQLTLSRVRKRYTKIVRAIAFLKMVVKLTAIQLALPCILATATFDFFSLDAGKARSLRSESKVSIFSEPNSENCDRCVKSSSEEEACVLFEDRAAINGGACDRRSGSKVSLNGQILPIAWGVWQQSNRTAIGLSDTAAWQHLRLELLSTTRPDKQPARWFPGEGSSPWELEAFSARTRRYLDVSPLVAKAGAEVRIEGETMAIATVPARVLGIRVGDREWGSRLVIDLDRPAFWHVRETRKTAEITISAIAPPELELEESPLYEVQSEPERTTLTVNFPPGLQLRTSSLDDPARIVLDLRPDAARDREIVWREGIIWRQQYVSLGDDRFPVTWLELDPTSPAFSLRPFWSNPQQVAGIEPLRTVANQQQAIAAINGGFFNRNTRLPLGAIRAGDRWISSPILNRGAIAWDGRGNLRVARLKLTEWLNITNARPVPLQSLNSGYVQAGIARYTPAWGSTYTPLSDNESIAVVSGDRLVRWFRGGKANTAEFPIPSDGYLLVVRGENSAFGSLATGASLELLSQTLPADFARYPHAIGAGPLLVKDGRVVLDAAAENFSDAFQRQAAVRSAIALTNRDRLIFAAIHVGTNGRGVTLAQTAEIMQQLGAVRALNLDGGSSTSLFLGGELINRSPATAARIHNGLGIFPTPRP